MRLQALRLDDYIEGLGDCCTVVFPGCGYEGRPCDINCIRYWADAQDYDTSKIYNQIRDSLYDPKKHRALFLCGGEIFDGNKMNSCACGIMIKEIREKWEWRGIIATQTEMSLNSFFETVARNDPNAWNIFLNSDIFIANEYLPLLKIPGRNIRRSTNQIIIQRNKDWKLDTDGHILISKDIAERNHITAMQLSEEYVQDHIGEEGAKNGLW